MKQYAGLDVSMKETSICVVDENGAVVAEGVARSCPEAVARWLSRKAGAVEKVGLETGSMSPWLFHGLSDLGLEVVCLCARQAKAVLSVRVNKTDRNDARGLAELVRGGFGREVRVKSERAQQVRAFLSARTRLIKLRVELENSVRGLLKPFGVLPGKGKGAVFPTRVRTALEERPDLLAIVAGLLSSHEAICAELAGMDRQMRGMARGDATCRLLMSMDGVGVVTALTFASAVEDPVHFRKSSAVGAWLGLTPRTHASGEQEWSGRISRCGDSALRGVLYEAANVLLTRVRRDSALKRWGRRLAKRLGYKRARVAVARRMAVVLHAMWKSGQTFRPEPCLPEPA